MEAVYKNSCPDFIRGNKKISVNEDLLAKRHTSIFKVCIPISEHVSFDFSLLRCVTESRAAYHIREKNTPFFRHIRHWRNIKTGNCLVA